MPHPGLGPVMLDLQGPELSCEEKDRLTHPATGGVILFKRNFASVPQIRDLISSIRSLRSDLLIAVDHEGGRVQRFRDGFTEIPKAMAYCEAGDAALCEGAGWLMAAELRAIGVDFSFAPVLDIETGISRVIGDRAFGKDPSEVIRYAGAFMTGMHRAGMAAVGKHFPGHGSVLEDSHEQLPVDGRPLKEILAHDLLPFQNFIARGIEGLMPAHVIYPSVDAAPAGFSKPWIQEILRGRLGFEGAVFSDDLSMAGAAFGGDPCQRSDLALAAGCDMILVCNDPLAIDQVLNHLGTPPQNNDRQERLSRFRARSHFDFERLQRDPVYLSLSQRLKILHHTA